MKQFLYVIFGFVAIWLFWYLSGGPLRSTRSKPFVNVNVAPFENTNFEYSEKIDTTDFEILKSKIENRNN